MSKTDNWLSFLKKNPLDWLLEEENPSVRYITLRDILGKPENNRNVQKARKLIGLTGVVPKILAKQDPEGFWETREHFYIKTKYKGTVWQFIILASLEADGKNRQIQNTCEFILKMSQDQKSGGFSYQGHSNNGGHHSKVIPCLTSNMVWSLIKLGYQADPRVQKGIDFMTTYQRFDDRVNKAPEGWPYDKYEACWGKHTCTMPIVKTLRALLEIPEKERTKKVTITIDNCVDFLLKHHIFKQSHDPGQIAKAAWAKFGFPLMWKTDALEMLGLLTRYGKKDSRMQEAVDLVVSKQDDKGRWNLESTFNGRFQVNIEKKGKPSKWITLHALKALKGYYS